MKTNAINWFEIYVTHFEASRRFYETILATRLEESATDDYQMGMFPFDMKVGIGGAITRMDGFKPGAGGTLVYLNVEGDLDSVLSRIPAAGGRVLRPRMAIPPHGFIAIFEDPEGNVVGLHSMS